MESHNIIYYENKLSKNINNFFLKYKLFIFKKKTNIQIKYTFDKKLYTL